MRNAQIARNVLNSPPLTKKANSPSQATPRHWFPHWNAGPGAHFGPYPLELLVMTTRTVQLLSTPLSAAPAADRAALCPPAAETPRHQVFRSAYCAADAPSPQFSAHLTNENRRTPLNTGYDTTASLLRDLYKTHTAR